MHIKQNIIETSGDIYELDKKAAFKKVLFLLLL